MWNVCEHGRLLMPLYVAQAINALAVLYACESSDLCTEAGYTHWIALCVLVYVLLPYTHSYRKCVLYDYLNWEGLFHYFCCVVFCCHPVCFSLTHSSTRFSHSVLCLYVCVCTNQRHCSYTVALLSAPVLESPAVNVSVISHVIRPILQCPKYWGAKENLQVSS